MSPSFKEISPKYNSQSSDYEKSSGMEKKVKLYVRSEKFKQLSLNFLSVK